jgi:hypothetical protein
MVGIIKLAIVESLKWVSRSPGICIDKTYTEELEKYCDRNEIKKSTTLLGDP